MPRLAEVQRDFAAAVFDNDTAILARIRDAGLPAQRRLAIYRNNTWLGLAEALRDGFPVVHRLVGTEFFDAMAHRFVAAFPPSSGCLLDYGAELPSFIASFDAAASLPYLADVARLDWAWHESFHADDARCFGLAELAALPPESYAGLWLRLHPSVRLLESAWPVLRIFEVNQPGYDGEPTIDLRLEGGCRVLVAREGWEVIVHSLSVGENAFLRALSQAGELEAAFQAATAADPKFEPTAALSRLLRLNVFYHPYY